MRNAILGSVLLATSVACTGCSGGADGEGSGGSGGSGSAAPLSFDAESSRPAAGGAAAAIAFAAQFGNTVASILEALGNAPEAGAFPVTQKINVSGFLCPGGGSADLTGQVVEGEEQRVFAGRGQRRHGDAAPRAERRGERRWLVPRLQKCPRRGDVQQAVPALRVGAPVERLRRHGASRV